MAGVFSVFAAIAVLPAQAQYSTSTLDVGSGPDLIAVNPVTNAIYVSRNGYVTESGFAWNTLIAIDGTTNAFSTIVAGNDPAGVVVNAVTNQIYVTSLPDSTITVIDGATNATTTLPIGWGRIAINPVTNKVYVNLGSTVAVIDGATKTFTSLAVGEQGDLPLTIAVNPVTNKIYASRLTFLDLGTSETLIVIDGATNGVTPIAYGTGVGVFAVNPVANKIYVGGDYMSVIDGATNAATVIGFGFSLHPLCRSGWVNVYTPDAGCPS